MRPRTGMASCPEALEILEFEKNRLRFKLRTRKSIFRAHRGQTSNLRRRRWGMGTHVVESDGKVCIERNCVPLSLLMSKNLKLKR